MLQIGHLDSKPAGAQEKLLAVGMLQRIQGLPLKAEHAESFRQVPSPDFFISIHYLLPAFLPQSTIS